MKPMLAAGMVLGIASVAAAVVIEVPVTPAYLKQEPRAFSIQVKLKSDGLIHFTIKRPVSEPHYIVAILTLRKGSQVVGQCNIPAYVRERSATYYVAIAPEYLPDSTFEISQRSFGGEEPNPVPFPGGMDYLIHLKDFAPKAPR